MGAALARDGPPLLQTLVSALLRTRLEIALAGLDGSGKTTVSILLQDPALVPATAPPTIGLVVQRAWHNGIRLTLWDLGGFRRFRADWGRHVRGCGALIFVVDGADGERLAEAREALQQLLDSQPSVRRMPMLVLVNKVDLLPAAERAREELLGWPGIVEELNLSRILDAGRWSVLGVSALRMINLDKILRWIVLQAHGAAREPEDEGGLPPEPSLWSWEGWRVRRRRWGKRSGFTLLSTTGPLGLGSGGALASSLLDGGGRETF